MKVVIIEDELAASENLAYLLGRIDPGIRILTVLDSVKASVDYFGGGGEADLIFMDIHLADGLSFEIFEQVPIHSPVVFTTAYDQYALKAFKVNSIDYLLKPIDPEDLRKALKQFHDQKEAPAIREEQVSGLLELLNRGSRTYKSTLLAAHRDELIPLKTAQIAYIHIDTGIVKATTFERQSHALDGKLEELEASLDPSRFFRANRQFLVNRDAIANIKYYFNGKLILQLNPPSGERVVVSKAKAPEFKEWINS
ncbi:LytTR family DNA-binding domain-containing protein [Robiginitalea sp. SC105]|uniref:LytR/AlgR family response regulator transcription factor n=1 Tax=Robiginitalea sp. SC105 TaxID=2762332 RepID=UPI00163A836D|nr:LytTR family DNA-binding domain-containing protein [Robiginitalea sp. SC105]MBC2839283.1 response regulator transcription factor [Robiginitalea sp. SC105]